MEHQQVKLGRIPKRVCLLYGIGEEGLVWAPNEFLDRLAVRYPDDYLRKVEEAAHILKEPQYGAYRQKTHTLYLVREYVIGASFCKVYIAIQCAFEKHWTEIGVLTPTQSQAILAQEEGMVWQAIPLGSPVCADTSRRKGNSRKPKKLRSKDKEDKVSTTKE